MPAFSIRLFALALACLGVAHAADDLALSAAQVKSLGIEVRVVDAGQGGSQGGLPARVTVPNEQLRVVAAPVAGMVERLDVAPGGSVKRGQVVARLASPQALELQRDALQAASQAQLAEQNRKRDEQLFAEGLIAESRLQASRATAAQAAAQASERRQGLALAGVAPGQVGGPLALVAPIDGVVLEQGASVGQRVEASALIYRIARLSPLWLEIQAPVGLVGGLREGASVQVVGSEARGRVIAVGRAVDEGSQTVLLRASVDAGAQSLRPGQTVSVALALPSAGTGLRLPTAAVARQGGEAVVFVQTATDAQGARFQPRAVKVGATQGDSVVVDGVQSGERVAVKGVSGLKALWTGVGKE